MLTRLPRAVASDSAGDLTAAVWIDLLDPTPDEAAAVQAAAGLRIPTREALSEIEASSRLYVENGAIYLSTPLLMPRDAGEPGITPVGLILTRDRLVTVRFSRLPAFDLTAHALEGEAQPVAVDVLARLIEAAVDRNADVLEHIGGELDGLSRDVFRPRIGRPAKRSGQFLRETLGELGRIGDRASQVRDVLLGVGRISGFTAETAHAFCPVDVEARLRAVREDLASLNDYEAHLTDKVHFLLDAVLGFISIEQNDVVKVLTIASIVGVPPVLVAGIYGMNFKRIPEYDWAFGYPYALALMAVTAIVPLIWFKWRGWM